jgi:hypothetical protein
MPLDKSIDSSPNSGKNQSIDFGMRNNKLRKFNEAQIADLYKNDHYLYSNMKMQQSMMSQGISFKPLPITKEGNDTSDFHSQHSEQISYMSDDKKAKRLTHEIQKMSKHNAHKFHDRIQGLKKKATEIDSKIGSSMNSSV